MNRIERKVVEGFDTQTVDVTGYKYGFYEDMDGGSLGQVVTNSRPYSDWNRFLINEGETTIKVIGSGAWKLHLQNTIPNANPFELRVIKTESGINDISGDDDIVFRGQDVDLDTVDISGKSINFDTLSDLYMTASRTKTEQDAAKYIKMKKKLQS
jgi:hypothetical protein